MDQTKSSDLEEDNSSFFEFDSDWLSSFDDSNLIDPKLNELQVPNLARSISNKFSDVESVDKKIKSTTTKRRTRLDQRFLTCCQNEAHIFSRLKIQSSDILNEVDERFICHKCNKSRRFFCYRCFDTAPKLIGKIPHIRLPIKIDIIKHSKEVDGKSTSPHAAVIAPEDVTIYIYPNLPTNWPKNLEGVFLVFPKKGSLTVKRFLSDYYQISSLRSETDIAFKIDCDKIEENSSESIPYGDNHIYHSNRKKSFEWDRFPIKTLVFIDSTWRQTKSILHNEILQKLPTLIIDSEETRFWRYHRNRPVHYLSTIEAIYYFLVQTHQTMEEIILRSKIPSSSINTDYDQNQINQGSKKKDARRTEKDELLIDRPELMADLFTGPYCGQYDNLLFFFKHTFFLIKNRYRL